METPLYPQYYRLKTRCLKRLGDTTTTEIVIPEANQPIPLCHQNVTYPSKDRLDEEVQKMEASNQQTYESYLCEFFQGAARNRETFNTIRQARHDQTKKQPV